MLPCLVVWCPDHYPGPGRTNAVTCTEYGITLWEFSFIAIIIVSETKKSIISYRGYDPGRGEP